MKPELLLLLTLVSFACSEATNGSSDHVMVAVDTIRGVVHVTNSGEAPRWIADPVTRIGSAHGGPAEFGRIRSITADGEGNVYVADNLAHEIRVFSVRSEHVRTIGRKGGGPGEFEDLYSLAWLGDNLAAMDPRNARISLLNIDGSWVDGIRYYPISGPPTLIRLHPLGSAGFYAPVPGPRGLGFVRITAQGAVDTIFIPARPRDVRPGYLTCRRADGGVTGISIPEAATVVYAFPPDGGAAAVSWTASFRIALIDPRGDTLRVVSRTQAPVTYSDTLWEEALKPYRELHQNFPGTRCEPETPQRPDARAALRDIVFDETGNMWVEAAAEAGFTWQVFDRHGYLIGEAPAPMRSTVVPPYVRAGVLYQVETDELGVEQVAVYRVAPHE